MYILDKKTTREQKLSKTRSFTACVEECFNGFHIIRQLNQCEQQKKKKDFKPIDIVYKPISNLEQKINCYFSTSMRNAYRVNSE